MASLMVGASGSSLMRLSVVTARARTFPDLTIGIAEGKGSITIATCPPITSVTWPCLYGTCRNWTFSLSWISSMTRCEAVPGP